MWFTRSLVTARARLENACRFEVESLERRVLLSSAIAAFHPPQNYPTGIDPVAVAIADVNHDGKPDLVVANFGDTISVLLGDGTGAFSSQRTFAAGQAPTDVAVADVNGDGKPDILVADYSGSIGVLFGNGDGTFQPLHTFAAGYTPAAIACADINGDGKLDALVANETSRTVSLLLGNGDGTFQSPQTFAVGAGPSSVAIADVNRDGTPDVVVTNSGNASVSVLLGTGGGFAPQQTFAAGRLPQSVVVSDVNSDGKPDLVLVNRADGNAAVLLGNGDGTFAAPMTFAAGAWANAVAVADMNGDGKEDLVVATAYPGNAAVLLGNGDGSFQPAVDFFIGRSPNNVAVADVNADGRPDIVTVDQRIDSASVFLADVPPRVVSIDRTNPLGVVTSDSSVTYTVTFNEPVTGVDPTDFTLALTGSVAATTPVIVGGSGAVYGVTVNGISGMGTLGLNLVDDGSIQDAAGNPLQPTGTAYFPSQATIAVGSNPVWMTTADVNGDGKPDLIVANRDDNSVGVLLGNGNGTFQAQITFYVSAPNFVAAADLNGDGKIDLITVDDQANSASVLLGNGNGTFQSQMSIAAGVYPSSVAAGDLNGDGKLDLIIGDRGSVGILLGNGNGTFQPLTTVTAGLGPISAVAADVNGDGKLDLIAVDRSASTASVLLGNGNGTFQTQAIFFTDSYPTSVVVSDVNGDGRADLITSNSNGTVSLLLGNGDGTFQAQTDFRTGIGTRSLTVTDINGDGRPDVAFANYGTYYNGIGVLLGNGDGTFQPGITFATGSYPSGIVAADFNGDGRPDVAVANARSNSVSIFLGPTDGSFDGQIYAISNLDTIAGTAGTDYVTLVQDPDHQHIDWFLSSHTETALGQLAINDPNGLTIDGMGSGPEGGDQVYLDYTNGNPLPDIVHVNEPQPANLVINGMSGSDPLATTTLDIGRSIVYVTEFSITSDPTALVRAWLAKGYNGGAWTGTGNAITSSAAAANHSAGLNTTGIGWANSEDGQKVNGAPFSIELMYTLYGDANLDGQVNSADLQRLLFGLNLPGSSTWDRGDFNYDGQANSADLQALLFNLNRSLGSQATPPAVPAILGNSTGSFTGQTHAIVPVADTINGTSGDDTITLQRNTDGTDINWTLGSSAGQFPANDPAGLTVNGNGGNDTINLDYTNGNPLPNTIHLNGTFTINNLQGTNPLAGTMLDIERSTVFISYGASDPIVAIKSYLQAGYNSGAWNGMPTASTGVITSAAAQANANHTTAIGYADSADGQGVNAMANTIELKYTLYGDANLDAQVNSADLQILLFNLNRAGAWDQGDFNYDGQVNSADLQALLFALNTSLGSQATPMAIAAIPATTPATTTRNSSNGRSPHLLPAINAAGSATTTSHHPHPAKVTARKRR